ncbi:MAG: LD-carboxypeptidase [Alphaproteobacteria bacterium]|nr:LD-carboxypeptidase [Alphaproteobacteria bacterium]
MPAWKALSEGSIIDIIAPGYGTTQTVARAFARALEEWGWKARFPKGMFGKDLLCAAPDEVRAKHLEAALHAEDSDAVWALRGGYGCTRLLPYLAKMKKPKRVKPLIGFSDLTALHLHLNQRWGWPSLHAPVGLGVAGKNLKAASRKDLELVLSGLSGGGRSSGGGGGGFSGGGGGGGGGGASGSW